MDRARNRSEPSGVLENGPTGASIKGDPVLEADGWMRRHLADPVRARESVELYESLGFEVLSRPLQPQDFGPECEACAVSVCTSYVLIYTRAARRCQEGVDVCDGPQ